MIILMNGKIKAELRNLSSFAVSLHGPLGAGKSSLLKATISGIDAHCTVIAPASSLMFEEAALHYAGAECVRVDARYLTAENILAALKSVKPQGIIFFLQAGDIITPEDNLEADLKVCVSSACFAPTWPMCYPDVLRGSGAVVLTHCDLLEACMFDEKLFWTAVSQIVPACEKRLRISTATGAGMAEWLEELYDGIEKTGVNNGRLR